MRGVLLVECGSWTAISGVWVAECKPLTVCSGQCARGVRDDSLRFECPSNARRSRLAESG